VNVAVGGGTQVPAPSGADGSLEAPPPRPGAVLP
jgi:hypothetical protein